MGKELVKRINCKNGQLVIHYNMELAERCISFAKKITKIGEKACMEAEKAERHGKEADAGKYWRMLAQEFDRLFGKGSSRIVFGSDMVNFVMMQEFWDKMIPYFEKWNKEVQNGTA